MRRHILAALALLLPAAASAQVWRAEVPNDDGAVLFYGLLAALFVAHLAVIRKRDPARIHLALVVWVVVGVAAALFPVARVPLALLVCVLLAYGFWRVT